MKAWTRRNWLGAVTGGLAVVAGAAWAGSSLLNDRDCYSGAVTYCINRPKLFGKISYPEATPYWRGAPGTGEDGLPLRIGPNGERFRNMSSVAMSGFQRSTGPFAERCREFEMTPLARKALDFLERNQKEIRGGAIVWDYNYATQLNDALLDAGWASAFAQSATIELFLLAHCKTGEARYWQEAKRAAAAFDISVTEGGLRSENPGLVWFQEVPLPDKHNPFIFNAHLYATSTLLLMHELSGERRYRDLAMKGVASIEKALPVIDTGNWNRYDLRPPFQAIICRQQPQKLKCKWVTGLFPQEFDPTNLSTTVHIDGPIPSTSSARPIDGEWQPIANPSAAGLSSFRWGSTAKEYIPWHADLIRSIGLRLNRADFIAAADRWMSYYADYLKAADSEAEPTKN